MEGTKYIGMDVHKDSISIAVLNSSGKLVMESIIETKAITILEFVHGLRGSLHLTFEEGTWAAWLYDLLKPHVTKLVVCEPLERNVRTILLNSKGLKINKNSAEGEVFFVDFPSYRTLQLRLRNARLAKQSRRQSPLVFPS
jgi:hypothetical protein